MPTLDQARDSMRRAVRKLEPTVEAIIDTVGVPAATGALVTHLGWIIYRFCQIGLKDEAMGVFGGLTMYIGSGQGSVLASPSSSLWNPESRTILYGVVELVEGTEQLLQTPLAMWVGRCRRRGSG